MEFFLSDAAEINPYLEPPQLIWDKRISPSLRPDNPIRFFCFKVQLLGDFQERVILTSE
jgi:hypothetical protein